jgi:hypothetical protein
MFITMFARVHHLVLPWDRWIHFTPSLSISLRFILILPSQVCLSGLYPSCFSNQNHVCQKIFRLGYLGIDIFSVHSVNKLTKLTNHLHGAETFKLSYSDSWEMLPLLWDPKVHYHFHRSIPLVPVLSHTTPVPSFPVYFFKIHSNIIVSSVPKSC